MANDACGLSPVFDKAKIPSIFIEDAEALEALALVGQPQVERGAQNGLHGSKNNQRTVPGNIPPPTKNPERKPPLNALIATDSSTHKLGVARYLHQTKHVLFTAPQLSRFSTQSQSSVWRDNYDFPCNDLESSSSNNYSHVGLSDFLMAAMLLCCWEGFVANCFVNFSEF